MGRAMMVTVGTGQTGHDIAGAIVKTINDANPDRILFVMTQKSREEVYVPLVSAKLPDKVKVEEKLLPDPDHVDEIYRNCCLFIDGLIAGGYDADQIVIDYTSGTKAMSAGVVLAGVAKGVGTLSYVTGKRGDGGRVIPGTEEIRRICPKEAYGDQYATEALKLFALYQFEAGLKLLMEAKALHQEPEFQRRISFLEKVGQAYWCWDRFLLHEAADRIHQIMESSEDKEFLLRLDMLNQVSANRGVLNKEKENPIAPERAADLLENARRRCAEGKYDDAMGRLYRLLEFLGQMRLQTKHSLNPSNLDLGKLSAGLKEKYNLSPNRFGKIQIGCYQCYDLLVELKDPCGEIMQGQEIKNLLEKRNHSILAHGFDAVGREDVEKMLAVMERTAKEFIGNFEELQGKVRFPQFPERAWEKLRRKSTEFVGRI